MFAVPHRRDFMLSSAALFAGLPAITAAETKLGSVVALEPDIEPLVKFIEETPRDRLLEEVAVRIRKGTTYREILTALLLAGVRNVEPRPAVGFKFHAVLVVNAAHLASLASPDEHRWLPIFWALDFFKDSQSKNATESKGWRMPAVDESAVPSARRAKQALMTALDNWDSAAADPAVAGLFRCAGADEVFEVFARYAARDFRAIGHKIIFASNAKRTLDTIGWRHAEPVLRSLAYALTQHNGDNPAKRDDPADRPGKRNRELVKEIPETWREGKPDNGATLEMLQVLRVGSEEDAARKVVELLKRGVHVQSIWDGVFAGSAELLMRKPGIVSLHASTTANAIRYAWETVRNDEDRRWLLLQNASFASLFRQENESRDKAVKLPERPIDKLEPETGGTLEGIFTQMSKDRPGAARKALSFLDGPAKAKELMDAARLNIFLKGNDTHDYKFSAAVLEDYYHISPAWRNKFLAASIFQLRPSTGVDTPLVRRTKEAFKV